LVGFILSLTGLLAPCMFPVGMVVSLFGLGKQPKGLAIAGLIIGAVGTLILVVIFAIYATVILACIGIAAAAQPVVATELAIDEAVVEIDDYYYENDDLPDEATGNALISGMLDGWERQLRYELDDDAFDGYLIRSAGPDGMFDTDDDSTSEDSYGEDLEDFGIDESDWDASEGDDSGTVDSDEGSIETADEVDADEGVIVD